MSSIASDRYTAKQIFIIREAIAEGRGAIAVEVNRPLAFAWAYLAADGAQLPGVELDTALRTRVNGQVLESLDGTPLDSQPQDPDCLAELVRREVGRILSEIAMARARQQPDLSGFRFCHTPDVRDLHFCLNLASHDLYGLGPGIIPRREIVVLPPGCDKVWWEPVYTAAQSPGHRTPDGRPNPVPA